MQSVHDGTASQMPAASVVTAPTSPPLFLTLAATAAAIGSSSPAAHTPPAPDATASEFPMSSERLLPTAPDSFAACPKIRWRKRRPTAASLPHSSTAPDASASPTTRSPEPAPQSQQKKSRRARTADSHPNSRQYNLPPPPTHKESPSADSFPPPPASVRQTR